MPKTSNFDESCMVAACEVPPEPKKNRISLRLRVDMAFLVRHYATASKRVRRLVRLGNRSIRFSMIIRRKL